MAFKMKGFSGFVNSPIKKKLPIDRSKDFDVDKIADADDEKFLKEQKEETVKYSELDAKGKATYNELRKKQKGPVETENKPSRQEIEDSYIIGEKLENFDTLSDIIDSKMKANKNK